MSSLLKGMVSSRPLGLFRVLFGLLLLFQFSKIAKRVPFFKDPDYLYFPFPELDWMPVFSYELMMGLLVVGFLATILFTIGLFYRYVAIIMALVYGYFFSLDAMYFNNHYYLIFLLCMLMCFTDADRSFAVSFSKKKTKARLPRWQYLILQLQIGIVFFYGGLSKCTADWFNGNVIKGITDSEFVNLFLIYGGTVFDMLIPVALFYKKTRPYAIILVILFNVSNHFLFNDIASFPLLVIASMLLFLPDGKFPEVIHSFFKLEQDKEKTGSFSLFSKMVLGCFFIFQFIYPLRHHLIKGHVDWTGQGHYFAWRMKSYHKDATVDFYAMDKNTNQRAYKINHGLDKYLIQRMTSMPHMIPKLSTYMRKQIEKQDGINPNLGIQIDNMVSLNHRKKKLAVNPSIDITQAKFSKYGNNKWIFNLD